MPLKEGKHSRFNHSKRRSSSKQRPKDSTAQKPATHASPAGTPLKDTDLSSKKIKKIQQLIYKDTQPFGLTAALRDEFDRDQQMKSFR